MGTSALIFGSGRTIESSDERYDLVNPPPEHDGAPRAREAASASATPPPLFSVQLEGAGPALEHFDDTLRALLDIARPR